MLPKVQPIKARSPYPKTSVNTKLWKTPCNPTLETASLGRIPKPNSLESDKHHRSY